MAIADRRFEATAEGWARFSGQDGVADYLETAAAKKGYFAGWRQVFLDVLTSLSLESHFERTHRTKATMVSGLRFASFDLHVTQPAFTCLGLVLFLQFGQFLPWQPPLRLTMCTQLARLPLAERNRDLLNPN